MLLVPSLLVACLPVLWRLVPLFALVGLRMSVCVFPLVQAFARCMCMHNILRLLRVANAASSLGT